MKMMKKITTIILCIITLLSVASVSAYAVTKPKCPQKAAVVAVSANAVKLAWSACEGAVGYRIYSNQNGKWKTIKDTSSTTVVISGLLASNKYTFAIRSAKKINGSIYFSDDNIKINFTTKGLVSPVISGVSDESSVRLSWNKIPGAKGYAVYSKVNGSWNLLGLIGKNYATLTKLKSRTTYTFAVKGVTEINGKYVGGPASNILNIKTKDSNKVKVACTGVSDSAFKISWTKADSATGYRIYALLNGSWKPVKDIMNANTLSHTFKKVESDTSYELKVRAFKLSGSSVKWYEPSDTCVATTNPGMLDLFVYRTDNLKTEFERDSYTFTYTSENERYGDVSVKISKNGDRYCLDSKVNKIPYVLFTDENSESYLILDESKSYIKIPAVLSSTFDVSKVMQEFFPDENWTSEVSLASFNSQRVVCESYTNTTRTKMLKFYYKTGKIVGIDEVSLTGTERAVVNSIEPYADENATFEVPEDYNRIFLGGIEDLELIFNQ